LLLINSVEQPADVKPKRKPPTPGSWRPGQSGNSAGRPRRGDALAEAIRERVSPDELIAVARSIIDDAKAPPSVRLQAAQFLAERGYSRPAERTELSIEQSTPRDFSHIPLARRRELLAELSGDAPVLPEQSASDEDNG
jgi:hypothetical protein